MALTILLAEDDAAITQMITFAMRMAWPGCQVAVAESGAEALRRFEEVRPDLVLLDVQMPPPDGFEVCRGIRATSTVPILMLTVRDDVVDKIRALDLGADDYVTKPFDPLELLARVRALLRRACGLGESTSTTISAAGVTLEPATHDLHAHGETTRLTTTEARLLHELMRYAGRTLPHDYLMRQVWGPEYVGDTHLLRVFVRRLRRKLGDDPDHPRYIQTEWNIGYRFATTPPATLDRADRRSRA